MAKCDQTLLAVLAPPPAQPNAPNSHERRGKQNNRVVDASAAKWNFLQDSLLCNAIPGKKIQRERFFSPFDKMDRFIQCREGQDRKNRAKDFLLHHRRIGRYGIQ